jgi:type III secretory pathway component EscT
MDPQNKPRRSAGFGLIVGVSLGVIVALVFKKLAIGVLLGIIVAYILYTADSKK